ncbi:MAG: VIT and VWA domain-containing protein [Firmicutes bacterium]|nr:VIT and VWA domain-containing protein [Bacillota bacterium]
MSCGLIAPDGTVMPLKKIDCNASITENFGIYTLTQHYYNEFNAPLSVRYVFPIPADSAVIDFRAIINGKIIVSKITDKDYARKALKSKENCAILSKHSAGTLEMRLGYAAPGSYIVVKIKYFAKIKIEDNFARLIIPTVIAPRYVSYGKQVAIESAVVKTGYKISLMMKYKGKNVADISSPTHDIAFESTDEGANISLKQEEYADRDIMIDIKLRGKNRPAMFYLNDVAYYCFTPKIDVYKRIPREYWFIIDTSDSMGGEKLKQAKNALSICLHSLYKEDSFNIIAFNTSYQYFSHTPRKFGEQSLFEAKKWLDSLVAEGGTELMRPVMIAGEQKGATVLLFTDGQIANCSDILSYVKSKCRSVFYTFGIDTAVNTEFLTSLANLTGGLARFITPDERIDEAIIHLFNKIAVPAIKNAKITFDANAQNITPKMIKQIHIGQRVTVVAKFSGAPPKKLMVTGEYVNLQSVTEVFFENPLRAGEELLYYFAKEQINHLTLMLTGDSVSDSLIRKQIYRLSVDGGILSEETAFVLTMGEKGKAKVIDAVVPSMLPAGWESPVSYMRETPKKKSKITDFLKIIKSQRANGSFVKTKVKTSIHTANILHYICTECDKADLFVWQLRKAAKFLLDDIIKSSNAQIPTEIIDALEAWHEKFGVKNDEISQKIGVLVYMYRKN